VTEGANARVAVVTGAGSGIGRATAFALAAGGVSVAVAERPDRISRAREVVAEIHERGGRAIDLPLEVTATYTLPPAFEHVADVLGGLDILVNNAGVQLIKPALDYDEDEFDAIMDVNLKGAFFCAQAAAAIMKARGNGRIVNIASQHGVVGNVDRAVYCASKGGLINLTRALAVEWAPLGILVNSVSPSFVITDENRLLYATSGASDQVEAFMPIKRAIEPDEVASAVVYLSSVASRSITGHNLVVDGGWTAR